MRAQTAHASRDTALAKSPEAERNGHAGPVPPAASNGDAVAGRRLSPAIAGAPPLVVDLDGTLLRSDLLIETAFRELGQRPASLLGMIGALRRGKAALKDFICRHSELDPAVLPYDPDVLAAIERAREQGRPVYLASASHERLVSAIAEHLDVFDGYFATDASSNLAGEAKAERLVQAFGEGRFDYIGNDAADLPVWARSRRPIAIRTSRRVSRQLAALSPRAEHLDHPQPTWKHWVKQFRVHHYVKNALVFLPLLAAHQFDAVSIATAALAAVAFCLCASTAYILNDLFDLHEDRQHRTKKARPLASGDIALKDALAAVPVLLGTAVVLAASISAPFTAVLIGYFVLTTLYSLHLKRLLLIDVLTLAGLYTIRMVGGAVAVGIVLSPWLLVFSLSVFLSLALMKRFVELTARADANLPGPSNRDYETGDLGMLAALAAAAGFNAVTVLALYLSSEAVNGLYTHPEWLWLACPILAFWLSRALILAQRRQMRDDPIVFALKDRQSRFSAAAMLALFVIAT